MKKLIVLAALLALPLAANAGDYDTMDIITNQSYDTANGDAWSGQGVFGVILDLQLADDVDGNAAYVRELEAGYVSFFGRAPANGLYVETYDDANCLPGNLICTGQLDANIFSTFADSIFGLAGVRIGATGFTSDVCKAQGKTWIVLQPTDLSASGDWYYICRDLDRTVGCDTAIRDGGKASGGYQFTNWQSAGNAGYGAGTAAMRVVCDDIPEPATLSLLGLGVLPFIRRKK
jgi:hypothetical protein